MDTTSEARFRGLLEAAPDAMICVDPDGLITLANAQAERLFGYEREELVGQPVEVLVPDAARSVHPYHRARYGRDPLPRPMGAGMALAGRRHDGTEFPAEISLSAIETDEGVLVSAAIRDVTERLEAQAERERLRGQAERERLERQLQQSQRLESLGQLAGGVAHDFNNLLLVIRNYALFVSEELVAADDGRPPDDWTAVRADADRIIDAADRATQLTRQLLAFGRREVVHPRPLVLNEVVIDIETALRRALGEHVELTVDLAPDLRPVMADPGQIEQVLVNVAVNARDAMDDGGTLHITTANVDDGVAVTITDTGSGMPAQVIDRAFEPFFTTKPKGEGSGLGLATVYGIVTQADGRVELASEIGSGTTVRVVFPATEAALVELEPPATPRPTRRSATILVVEDEDDVRAITCRILTRNGYRVIPAAGAAEAIAIADDPAAGNIDLLLTDVVMPQMLGKELVERVRDLRPSTRVVFMSGYAQPVLGSRGTLDDGVVLIEKPFSQDALLQVVAGALADA